MRFWSDEFCVWWVTTFEAMPLPYKLVDLGFVMAPLAVTCAAFLQHEKILHFECWLCAGILWVLVIQLIANYVRGNFALRRGVQPVAPTTWRHQQQNLQLQKWCLIVSATIVTLLFILAVSLHGGRPDDWSEVLFLLGILLMQLPMYARQRFSTGLVVN